MLTDQFQFQPEEFITLDGKTYAVFFDTETGGDFPILALVDSDNFMKAGTTVITLEDEQAFADRYGYIFRGHEDLLVSDILTITEGKDAKDYRTVMDIEEDAIEKRAKEDGMKWLLDRDVQTVFLSAILTGQPVSIDDLAGTDWFDSSTPEQRNFMAEYYGDPNAVENKVATNIKDIRTKMFEMGFKGDITRLSEVLAYGVVSNQYTPEQVDSYLSYIGDETYMNIAGGIQVLPEELQQFADQFETTEGMTGQFSATSYVKDYLGPNVLAAYEKDGTLLRYAGMIRNGQTQKVLDELQTSHDIMYPAFQGAKYNTWNTHFSDRASKTINGTLGIRAVDLTKNQQATINDLIVEAKGDYQEFDKLVRKNYKNSPGVKNTIKSEMLNLIPQAVSGVF
jgi:hypothetical protein|tara:strand:+ start:826 stop:2010 length:1185 start_codon:yes stop_codon:yes gene_type:complete